MGEISTFKDLTAWQKAHRLVLLVYQITGELPSEERFGLVSQMPKAAILNPANMAKGFKKRGLADKIRFYNMAEGSLEELKYYLILSQDLRYIQTNEKLTTQAEKVGNLLNGLIISTERRQ